MFNFIHYDSNSISSKRDYRSEAFDKEEHYLSLINRKYLYKIECYVLKEERSGTITDIDNIDFTISYKEFLNFLKDDPLWD